MVVTGAFRQQAELRKDRRQPLHYPAWLVLAPDNEPLQCMLSDVSKSGAKITVPGEQPIPDEFLLLLSIDGKTRRNCRVIWRGDGRHIGVEFHASQINWAENPKAAAD